MYFFEVRSKCHTHPDKNKGLRFSNAIFSFGDLNDGELCRTLTLCYQFPDLQIKKNGKLIHVMKLKSLLNPFLKQNHYYHLHFQPEGNF